MKNVAVIGFGFMGITHVLNIHRNKNLKLVAIIRRDVEGIDQKLKSRTGNFSIGDLDTDFIKTIPAYATLQECLQHEKLDAVHICVHTDLHYALAKEAIENGLHVLLEKPMSLNLQECRDLIELAREKNRILMVGHVLRFMSPYQKLKEWIDSGEFGALQFLSLTRFSGLPSWGQWKEKQQDFGSSGGALFDLLIHDIDFLNATLGKPQQISAFYLPGALSKHDYVHALWSYPDRNITAKIEGGNIFHSEFPFQAGYKAKFDRASVLYSTIQPEFIQVATPENLQNISAGDANEGFYKEIDYFASCIGTHTWPHECPPESSLETIELCYKHI